MEELFEVIKNFLTTQFNEELAEYDDPAPAPELPRLNNKSVIFGTVDPLKVPDVSVSVLPETQEDGEGTISDVVTKSEFTVTFVFKGCKYDYPDCGAVEKTMTAAEINLTIYTSEDY